MCLRVTFATQLPSQGSLKMIKALSLRLNQCFCPFTILPFERSSRTGVFGHLFKHVFRGRKFRKYISYEGHLFLEIFEIYCRFLKGRKKIRKNLLFLRQMHLNCFHSLVSINKGILVISIPCVKNRSEEVSCV